MRGTENSKISATRPSAPLGRWISYQAFCAARAMEGPNEIKTFYEASFERTGNATHARLNTQRKILESMWALWKNGAHYDPKKLLGPASCAA
jgi:hypothetical protein